MARKKLILFGLISLLMLLSINLVFAQSAASIVTPPANAGIKGTILIQATFTEGVGARNVTFWRRASGVTDWTPIGPNQSSVSSGGTVTINRSSFDTTTLSDALDYDFNVTVCEAIACGNGYNTSDSNTGIDIDNSAPTAAISIDKARQQIQSGAGIEVDCRRSADVQGIANTTILLTKADNELVTKASTDIYTFTDSDINVKGEYTATCRPYNLAATSTDVTGTFTIGDGKIQIQKAEAITRATTRNNTPIIIGSALGFILSMSILLYFAFKK